MNLVLPVVFVLVFSTTSASPIAHKDTDDLFPKSEDPQDALEQNVGKNTYNVNFLKPVLLPMKTLPETNSEPASNFAKNNSKPIYSASVQEHATELLYNPLKGPEIMVQGESNKKEVNQDMNEIRLTEPITSYQYVLARRLNIKNITANGSEKQRPKTIIRPSDGSKTSLLQRNVIRSRSKESFSINVQTENTDKVYQLSYDGPVKESESPASPKTTDKLIQEAILAPIQVMEPKGSAVAEQEIDNTLDHLNLTNILAKESINALALESITVVELNSFPPLALECLLPPTETSRTVSSTLPKPKLLFGIVQDSDITPVNTLLNLWESDEDGKPGSVKIYIKKKKTVATSTLSLQSVYMY